MAGGAVNNDAEEFMIQASRVPLLSMGCTGGCVCHNGHMTLMLTVARCSSTGRTSVPSSVVHLLDPGAAALDAVSDTESPQTRGFSPGTPDTGGRSFTIK